MKYGLSLIIAVCLSGIFFLSQGSWVESLVLGIGLAMGIGLLWIDERFGHQWYNEPTTQSLITRTPFFWLAYVPLAIFVVSSSGSALGTGIIFGLGFHLWLEMILLAKTPHQFTERFLSQVKRQLSAVEIQRLCIIATGLMAVLVLTALW